MNLMKSENLIFNSKNTIREFTVFSWNDEEKYIRYFLVSNHSETGFLFPEYKNIDFLFQIEGSVSEEFTADLLQKIKKIELIHAVFPIDINSLKGKERLIFH